MDRDTVYKLNPDEWLMKINADKMCFLAKPLKSKGTVGENFRNWKGTFKGIHTETFRSGWAFDGFRIGKSQQWARFMSPEGWKIEIYLNKRWKPTSKIYKDAMDCKDIFNNCSFINGELIGEWMWNNNYLFKKPD